MKTSHILLGGSVLVAYLQRNEIKKFIEKQSNVVTEKVSSYAANQVDIKPYKMPKIGFSLSKKAVRLEGSVEIENKSPLSVKLNTYQISVTLESKGKFLSLGKTPLMQPQATIAPNSKTKVSYKFYLPVETISSLIADNKDLINYDLYINLNKMDVSGFNLPPQKIAITSKWRDVLNIVNNPTSLLDKLFKF
jgi:hypothetical protein